MPCHVLGLLLTIFVCWNLCQGFIEPCDTRRGGSANGTIVFVKTNKPAIATFCVLADSVHPHVQITYKHNISRYYTDKTVDIKIKISLEQNYHTVQIMFSNVQKSALNTTFSVKIVTLGHAQSGWRNNDFVIFTFVLQEEQKQTSALHKVTISSSVRTLPPYIAGTSDPPSDKSYALVSEEMTNAVFIPIAVATVIIISVIIGVLIHRYKGSGHKDKSRDQSTCPVELNSLYTHYEEIKDVETCSREQSSVPANRAFSEEQREQIEYEIPVQVRPRDDTPDCYVELMDVPSGVPAITAGSAAKGISQFFDVVEYENTLPVLKR